MPRGGPLDWRALTRSPRPAVVLFVGIDTPRDYGPLVRLADGLARGGAVVLVPETPRLLDWRFDALEADSLVVAFEYLAQLPAVDDERIGFAGFSVGGSLALLAAADPRIQDRLAYVHAFGAYADAGELLAAATTQRVPATGEPWVPDGVTRKVLQLKLLDWVTNEDDRAALTAVLPPPGEPWQVAACPPLGYRRGSVLLPSGDGTSRGGASDRALCRRKWSAGSARSRRWRCSTRYRRQCS